MLISTWKYSVIFLWMQAFRRGLSIPPRLICQTRKNNTIDWHVKIIYLSNLTPDLYMRLNFPQWEKKIFSNKLRHLLNHNRDAFPSFIELQRCHSPVELDSIKCLFCTLSEECDKWERYEWLKAKEIKVRVTSVEKIRSHSRHRNTVIRLVVEMTRPFLGLSFLFLHPRKVKFISENFYCVRCTIPMNLHWIKSKCTRLGTTCEVITKVLAFHGYCILVCRVASVLVKTQRQTHLKDCSRGSSSTFVI